jgi:hypothetical protein
MILELFISLTLQAKETKSLCEDIATFTCKSIKIDDGTGFVDPSKNIIQKAHDFYYGMTEQTKLLLSKEINSDENLEMRPQLIELLDLAQDLPCYKNKTLKDKQECDEKIIRRLVQFANPFIDDIEKISLMYQGSKKLDSENKTANFQVLAANPKLQKISEKVKNLLAEENRKSLVLANIRDSVFPKVKELLIERVKKIDLEAYEKTMMVKRLNNVKFGGFSCQKYNDFLQQNFVSDLYWDETSNELTVCPGFVNGRTSQFSIGFSVAREISKTISPHQWAKRTDASLVSENKISQIEQKYPVNELPMCLRLNSSVFARESIPYFGGDQLSEATSDWWAAEIIAKYVESLPRVANQKIFYDYGYSNILRGQDCRESKFYSPYPDVQVRTNALLRVQPKIRSHLKCAAIKPTEEYQYCSSDSAVDKSNMATTDSSESGDVAAAAGAGTDAAAAAEASGKPSDLTAKSNDGNSFVNEGGRSPASINNAAISATVGATVGTTTGASALSGAAAEASKSGSENLAVPPVGPERDPASVLNDPLDAPIVSKSRDYSNTPTVKWGEADVPLEQTVERNLPMGPLEEEAAP